MEYKGENEKPDWLTVGRKDMMAPREARRFQKTDLLSDILWHILMISSKIISDFTEVA